MSGELQHPEDSHQAEHLRGRRLVTSCVFLLPQQLTVPRYTHLNDLPQVAEVGLCAQQEVEGQGDVDGDHRHHVDDVQRMAEELPLVGRQQQPRHHLGVRGGRLSFAICYKTFFILNRPQKPTLQLVLASSIPR